MKSLKETDLGVARLYLTFKRMDRQVWAALILMILKTFSSNTFSNEALPENLSYLFECNPKRYLDGWK